MRRPTPHGTAACATPATSPGLPAPDAQVRAQQACRATAQPPRGCVSPQAPRPHRPRPAPLAHSKAAVPASPSPLPHSASSPSLLSEIQCPSGSGRSSSNPSTCSACNTTSYSRGGGITTTACLPCAANAASNATRDGCVCDAGYESWAAGAGCTGAGTAGMQGHRSAAKGLRFSSSPRPHRPRPAPLAHSKAAVPASPSPLPFRLLSLPALRDPVPFGLWPEQLKPQHLQRMQRHQLQPRRRHHHHRVPALRRQCDVQRHTGRLRVRRRR
jgi:hypothetical protein